MGKAGISGLVSKKRGRTTIRVPGVRVADDLVQRDFRPGAPNVLWVADLTYLRTWEGWLYLVAVQDAFSRRIVGWSMADHMRADLVVDALNMAIARRRPDAGLIHHSDQGSQFVSLAFGQACGKAGVARSMGSRGDCFDNAVAESFFATLKKELIRRQSWPTRAELRQAVFEYIELFYNATRRHSTLGFLSPAEYERVLALCAQDHGRPPTLAELGMFAALWSEHCSYKSSRHLLKGLPVSGPRVLQGPGENAGAIDVGDGQAVVFKMESHNHPSFIEPYQGAATGVGGILRDVFTMGARPIACLDCLRFGRPDHPRTAALVKGVVAGIAGYGNAFGVPTVAGDLAMDECYDGNILVNAMAVGLCRADRIFRGTASGVGNPVLYLGQKTGRDGIHGATMASAEFAEGDAKAQEKRPRVQVGDPFTGKRILEAFGTTEMPTGVVAFPLIAHDTVLGVLRLVREHGEGPFAREARGTLEALANLAAAAILEERSRREAALRFSSIGRYSAIEAR